MNKVQFVPADNEAAIGKVASMADIIWREHYRDILSAEQIGYMLDRFQSPRAIADAIAGGYEYDIITGDGKDLGYIGIKENEPRGKLFLSKLYLLREHRGQGHAARAVELLAKQCGRKGLGAIWLTVNRDNPSVERYKKIGFKILRPVVTDIGNGFVMDDYMMEKSVR
jgi:GNAT superfamily N-acetyltransferase